MAAYNSYKRTGTAYGIKPDAMYTDPHDAAEVASAEFAVLTTRGGHHMAILSQRRAAVGGHTFYSYPIVSEVHWDLSSLNPYLFQESRWTNWFGVQWAHQALLVAIPPATGRSSTSAVASR